MKRFVGQTVFVTGGNKGIGRGIAGRFAAEGARVAIAAIEKDTAAAAATTTAHHRAAGEIGTAAQAMLRGATRYASVLNHKPRPNNRNTSANARPSASCVICSSVRARTRW